MIMWLFHECRLTHSCKANNRPCNVNAPTKTAGCRNGGTVRPLIVGNKFSGEPCALYTICGPSFRNWREEAIDPHQNHPARRQCQPSENHGWEFLSYRRTEEQESDGRTTPSRRRK